MIQASTPVTINLSSQAQDVFSELFGITTSRHPDWISSTQARANEMCESSKSALLTPIGIPSSNGKQQNGNGLANLCDQVQKSGFAVYSLINTSSLGNTASNTDSVVSLLHALNLRDSDSGVIRGSDQLSLLHDASGTPKGRFPPYQPSTMNWHTDGYYNANEETIRCFSLHCLHPAATGGALRLMDDAFLILALLHDNPESLRLLAHPEAMTLPQNKDAQGHDRPDRTVPMIQQHMDGNLSIRFTTRRQNIRWRCEATKSAAVRANQLIDSNEHWHCRVKLEQNQGVITRNILHSREAFNDAPGQPKRQMLRGRFTSIPVPALDRTVL